MNCSEVRELLLPFSDDELDDEVAAQVQAEVDHCPGCRAELDEIAAIRSMAREALLAPVEAVDLSGVFDGVMARIEAEDAATVAIERTEKAPGFLDRLTRWVEDVFTFQQPMVSLATFAALALVVGGAWWTQQNSSPAIPGGTSAPSVAQPSTPPTIPSVAPDLRRRRSAEGEFLASTEAVIVESIDATGKVEIDDEEPEGAVVVWHIHDESSQAAEREL